MPEKTIKLNGWAAVIALVAVVGLTGFRLMTFSDQRNNDALMEKLQLQILSDYYPGEAARMEAAMQTGDSQAIHDVAQSVTSTRANIESVKTSYPLFSLTSRRDVVVKVVFSLEDDEGIHDRKTRYYLYSNGAIGNNWSFRYQTSVISYYLNFI